LEFLQIVILIILSFYLKNHVTDKNNMFLLK
jgi:hypothetical protein